MLKIGILGCSSIAKKALIPAINQHPNTVLSGVASRDLSKAKALALIHKTKYYSYKELLDSDVDAIYVSTPVGLHYKWGKQVLESGKHLLLEKTFTENLKQAKELFDIASKNNLTCMEALMYEFHPLHSEIDMLKNQLGKIRYVEAHFEFPHFKNKDDIRYKKELGGGAILDCLVYPLSFVFRILGTNIMKTNASIYYNKETGLDDRGYIQLEYEKTNAYISYGFGHSYRNEIAISGTEGILKVKRAFTRTVDCKEPIELWSNGMCKKISVEKSNYFVSMLHFFLENIDAGISPAASTIDRMKFIEKL
jgi:NDP-hexose-3-ketoreductase